jgi:hypothetical protein
VTTVHVYPTGDLIDHELDGDDCPCGPTTEPVPTDDGSMGWLIVHHSIDGRERTEKMSTCAKCTRGRHDLCTGYDGDLSTHPDSLPPCACVHARHRYDLATKTCGCGQMMWPDDHAEHLAKVTARRGPRQ